MNISGLAPNGKAAIAYASKLKWAVFPIHTPMDKYCSCKNPKCTSVGKHPRVSRVLKEATINLELIFKWWKKWPEANIGIATGEHSDLVALDIDPRHGGEESLTKLIEEYSSLPKTIEEAVTGGGGRHILFKPTCLSNRNNILPGIDIRGDGGYKVVPPSLHVSGNKYEWELSSRPLEVPLKSISSWLLQMLIETGRGDLNKKPKSHWAKILKGVGEGERNLTAASLAGYLLRHGIAAPVAYELMLTWNQRNNPPESIEAIEFTFNSILRRELKRLKGGGVIED